MKKFQKELILQKYLSVNGKWSPHKSENRKEELIALGKIPVFKGAPKQSTFVKSAEFNTYIRRDELSHLDKFTEALFQERNDSSWRDVSEKRQLIS
jgi:hypothetical protein